ncbi:MAG TPA: ABC transporter permease [Anaerolineae bacterium]|nr:ABC transporter permease [Anaerolineae bacterium]
MFLRTFSLVRKEFIHIGRDPRTLAIMIIMPLMQLILLGYAATTDIEHLRTAVYDGDRSQASRDLIQTYQASNYFDIVAYVDKEADLTYLLDHGDVRGALIIPAGFGEQMAARERPDIAFLVDGSDPTVANTVYAASQQVGQALSSRLIERELGRQVSELPGVEVRPRVWYNPNLESTYFTIPGLMVIVLFLYTTLFTSTAIVRERELGTIEQLIVTPIRPLELIVAKVIPYILISFLIIIEVLTIGVLVFGVPIQGSVPLLLGLAGLFLITALGIGILISSVANNQQEAMMLTFATMLPTFILSGFFFPIDAMPRWMQFLTYLIPARYGMVIVRGIVLKGVGVELLFEQIVAVLIFSVVVIILASRRFKKKLE